MNIEDLSALAKSRGLFWPSAEIYGGASGIYDYGNIGALLKKRFESIWTSFFVDTNTNYHIIEGSTILPASPLIYSGHASRFNDVIVGCTKCNSFYRADVLLNDLNIKVSEAATPKEIDDIIKKNKIKCPKCKSIAFSDSKQFNMMMDVHLGPENADLAYLRPETAQSVYLNFIREFNILRKTLPLGLAIIGKAYRNEISPRQGLYRLRELTQAELQIFFDPQNWKPDLSELKNRKINVIMYEKGSQERLTIAQIIEKYEIPKFYAYHLALIDVFYTDVLKVPEDKIRFLQKGGDEKAFYNKIHMDVELNVESWNSFKEVAGLHYRGDYDLTQHAKGSKQDMSVLVGQTKLTPHVLELSFGVDRNIWALVDLLFKKQEDQRTILQIPFFLAPYPVAVFALQKEEKINKMVEKLHKSIRPFFKTFLDDSGSIGRRYARMDEIGTPFCITVDYESVNEHSEHFNTVTIRSRDSKDQLRIKIDKIADYIRQEVSFNPYNYFGFE